jgi:hypothetical protein
MSRTAKAMAPTVVSVAGVPRFVRFTGTLARFPSTPKVRMLFSLYQEREGQTPLFQEALDVKADAQGHFTVLLGSTRKDGLPKTLFVDGKAHWLGMQVQPGQGQEAAIQQPSAADEERVLLVGVPYALKAVDADTLGGLPASAFIHTKVNPKTGKPLTTKGATADANFNGPKRCNEWVSCIEPVGMTNAWANVVVPNRSKSRVTAHSAIVFRFCGAVFALAVFFLAGIRVVFLLFLTSSSLLRRER